MSGVQHAVLTAIGPDHPGLVDEVTRFVAECGATSRTVAWSTCAASSR